MTELKQPPETIYLIPGEYEEGWVWCDDPAPSYACNPDGAIEYTRADGWEDYENGKKKH